jgi:DNA-binding IclR family transcriptional regulator
VPGNADNGTQSIKRAVEVINLIASYSTEGLRVVEVANALKLSRPTVHRIAQALVHEGWLSKSADGKRYFLGHSLFELGLTAAPRFKFRELCQPSLNRIARKTRHIAFLTIRSGKDAISIARSVGKEVDHDALQIGVHRPLGIGAGSLALLVTLNDDEVSQVVMSNARRLRTFADVNVGMLLKQANICREQGFATHDESLLRGVSGVAICLSDSHGVVVGAISISALVPRLEKAEVTEILKALRAEARVIEKLLRHDLGYAAERVRTLSKI